jgi:PPOX class probable F420-dependent enzyme
MANVASADTVSRDELLEFLRPRHKGIYVTTRGDGRPQLSPVSCGVDPEGRIVVSTYPQRAKTSNTRRDPEVSICILSDDFDGPWVQVYGTAEVLDMPGAAEPLVRRITDSATQATRTSGTEFIGGSRLKDPASWTA